MLEKMIFKVFGSTEQEVRKALSDAGITPLLVEVDCLDAKIVVT